MFFLALLSIFLIGSSSLLFFSGQKLREVYSIYTTVGCVSEYLIFEIPNLTKCCEKFLVLVQVINITRLAKFYIDRAPFFNDYV